MTSSWPYAHRRHRRCRGHRAALVVRAVTGARAVVTRDDEAARDRKPVPADLARALLPGAVEPGHRRRAAAGGDRPVRRQHQQLALPDRHGGRARGAHARRRPLRADGRDRALPGRRPPDDPGRRAHRAARQPARQGRRLLRAGGRLQDEEGDRSSSSRSSSCSSRSSSVSSPSPRLPRCTASLARSSETLTTRSKDTHRVVRLTTPTARSTT